MLNLELSCFEIIGPVMIGPSSSHTAGACKIAKWARLINGGLTPDSVRLTLYGSFAKTASGHGTDRALLAGLLGFEVDDLRIRQAFSEAAKQHLRYEIITDSETMVEHPNTAKIEMFTAGQNKIEVVGESIGGGRARIVEINGIRVDFSGRLNTLLVEQRDVAGVLAYITACLSAEALNIAFLNMFREKKGERAFTLIETDALIPLGVLDKLAQHQAIYRVLVLRNEAVEDNNPSILSTPLLLHQENIQTPSALLEESYLFATAAELLTLCERYNISVSELMQRREAKISGMSRAEIRQKMLYVWETMQTAVEKALTAPEKSMGKLLGGEAQKVMRRLQSAQPYGGKEMAHALAYALGTLEHNAAMGKIVAAPTAGASGVLPAVLKVMSEFHNYTEEEIIDALFMAGAIGFLINLHSSLAGATGGCQAEVGSAAAMAAAAVCELAKLPVATALQAATMAMMNLLGLVCDPIGGLVEVPCQIRNGIGAAAALTAAELAASEIAMIVSFDEMVAVQKKVGDALPAALRETADGGIAQAPSALDYCQSGPCSSCAFS